MSYSCLNPYGGMIDGRMNDPMQAQRFAFLNNESIILEQELRKQKQEIRQKKIDDIPNMSNRQLLEKIYKILLEES